MKNMTRIYKVLLLFSLLATALVAKAQDYDCTITCSDTVPVCSQTPVTLSVPNNYLYTYRWTPGNYTTNRITVRPFETTTYHVYVTDTAGMDVCNNSYTVEVLPRFTTSMRQLRLTCSNPENENGQSAQIKVDVTDAVEPLTYTWYSGTPGHWHYNNHLVSEINITDDRTVVVGLLAYTWYFVEVEDGRGCVQYDSIYTRGFPTPVIEITCEPSDSVYIQNPDVAFSFENLSVDSIPIDHFFWTFEHGQTTTSATPVFTYVEPKYTSDEHYLPTLTVYDDCGCDTTYVHDVYVLPVKLKVPSVFTPNGDGHNDTFVISLDDSGSGSNRGGSTSDPKPLSTYYKHTELIVMNRWGRIVYHSNDYQNDWDGGDLADGTYFYILKCTGLKEVVQYQGSVMILTESRK